MPSKIGQQCDQCFKGSFEQGPFEANNLGAFIFCNNCKHKEADENPPTPQPVPQKKTTPKAAEKIPLHNEPQPEEKTKDIQLALRVIAMPKETNQYGTIFGGVILSYIDQASFVEARRHGLHRWVTASMDRVDFLKPVRVGDTVSLYARTIKTGTKSVQVGVEVEVDRYNTNVREHVCSASVTMVSVDPDGKPIPFMSPSTIQYRS